MGGRGVERGGKKGKEGRNKEYHNQSREAVKSETLYSPRLH